MAGYVPVATTEASAGMFEQYQTYLQSSPISSEMFEGGFGHLQGEEKGLLVDLNKFAITGRAIANHLSNLVAHDGSQERAYDYYGSFTNLLGHLINVGLIARMSTSDATAQEYIKTVNAVADTVFTRISERASLGAMNKVNITRELKEIDVPRGVFAQDMVILAKESMSEKDACLQTMCQEGFEPKVILRNKTRDGMSLRAFPKSEELRQHVLERVTKLMEESGVLLEGELEDTAKYFSDCVCVMIEARDVYGYIEENAPNVEFAAAAEGAGVMTAKGLLEAAREQLFSQITTKMQEFVASNPVFSFDLQSLSAFMIQDFNPRKLGAKLVVDGASINAVRQDILPGVKDIQFPRIALMGLPLKGFDPLQLGGAEGEVDILTYLQSTLSEVRTPRLELAQMLLGRDVTWRKQSEAIDVAQAKIAYLAVMDSSESKK